MHVSSASSSNALQPIRANETRVLRLLAPFHYKFRFKIRLPQTLAVFPEDTAQVGFVQFGTEFTYG